MTASGKSVRVSGLFGIQFATFRYRGGAAVAKDKIETLTGLHPVKSKTGKP